MTRRRRRVRVEDEYESEDGLVEDESKANTCRRRVKGQGLGMGRVDG